MQQHVKTRSDAPAGFFAVEAAGLEWLAAAKGARVARVAAVARDRIVLERIIEAQFCTFLAPVAGFLRTSSTSARNE